MSLDVQFLGSASLSASLRTNVSNLRIQPAQLGDAARSAELAGQLGHTVAPADMRSRLERALSKNGNLVLIAETDERGIIGWLHATVSRPLVDSRQGISRAWWSTDDTGATEPVAP
jgi:hypothetical protein